MSISCDVIQINFQHSLEHQTGWVTLLPGAGKSSYIPIHKGHVKVRAKVHTQMSGR